MRYRIGEDPVTSSGGAGTEAVLVFTLVLGIVFGLVLLWLGVRGRQLWLIVWSAGLVVVSIGTWISLAR